MTVVELQETAWSDTRIVRECLNGNEEAWSALVDKYKNLIYSVPLKYGFSRDEAADIFQMVCLELLSQLSRLREPRALPKWLLMVTSHKCYHLKHQIRRNADKMAAAWDGSEGTLPSESEEILCQAEQEQHLRDAVAALCGRCRELVRMLFFEEPARPYQEIAARLGLATGSIGFVRQRCLHQLRKKLHERRHR